MSVSRFETLPVADESPAIARGLIRSEMADCDDEAVAAAEVMISEVVSNAVIHGASPIRLEVHHGAEADGGEADFVRAAVTDGGEGRPVPLNPKESDPHGRGLLIVGSLADDWGVTEDDAGKSVWFTLPCRSSESPLS